MEIIQEILIISAVKAVTTFHGEPVWSKYRRQFEGGAECNRWTN